MFTERFAIQQRMSEIKDERRQLNEEYYRLLERLRTLDEKSAIGEEGTDVSGLAAQLAEAVKTVSQLVPDISVQQVIDDIKKNTNAEEIVNRGEDQKEEAPKIDKVAIDTAKQSEKKRTGKSKVVKLTPLDAAPTIISIIKEAGEIKANDIKKELAERGTPVTDIYGALKWAMDTNKNIVKGGFGMYKYEAPEEEPVDFGVFSYKK